MKLTPPLFAVLLTLAANQATADEPVVVRASAIETARGTWSFSVTIRHGDTGWEDYADGWAIEDAAGNELGFRLLAHPHVNEQPFTRSLSNVEIPEELKQVFIRTRDLTGFGKELFLLDLGE